MKNYLLNYEKIFMTKYCSIYFHIPFCASKCNYCDFYSKPRADTFFKRYCDSLLKELEYHCKHNNLPEYTVSTIFFGGGTPSLLGPEMIFHLCSEIRKQISLDEKYEWTIECNPDSFSEELAKSLLEAGVNRLSFGIQSLNDQELGLLGRRHSAKKAMDVLNMKILSQFNSISTDLIYGIPAQTLRSFSFTLDNILKTESIKHLSAYELTINKNTPFGRHRQKLHLPDETALDEMTELLLSTMKRASFNHYEISNFALPSYNCRHNENYWNHGNYFGVGASAHSYIHPLRWANVSDIEKYICLCDEGKEPVDFSEIIDAGKMTDEMLLLGFRKQSGIDEDDFEKRTQKQFRTEENSETLETLVNEGYIVYEKPFWKPTEKGMLFADAIAGKLSV